MALILRKLNIVIKREIFTLQVFHIWLIVLLLMQSRFGNAVYWIFLKIFICYFLHVNSRKTTWKKVLLKKWQFSVKILARFWLMWFFYRLSFLTKVILLICSNITMLEFLKYRQFYFHAFKCYFFRILLTWINLTMSID